MNKLLEMWKWKMYVTLLVVGIFTLPIVFNWENFSVMEIILIYTSMPILTWLSLTYSLNEYGKELEKESDKIKSRYAVKNVNPDFYQTVKVTSNGIESTPLSSINKDGPYKLGEIQFLDINVSVYHDKYMESEDSAAAVWQARNTDSFYTGPVFMNWETGKMTYPDGVNPPEPKHEDYEMLPKFVVTGSKELNSKTITGILNYFSKEYMRRNKKWLENKNK